MALGGGIFTSQNKVLPGSYINFVSSATASAVLSDRGIATMPLELDWGVEGEVFEVTSADFYKNSEKIFGYAYDHDKMKGLRDLFKNVNTLYAYRINSGTKASNGIATAKFSGVLGNNIEVTCEMSVDGDYDIYTVTTKFEGVVVDKQSIRQNAQTGTNEGELVDNDYVTFKSMSPTGSGKLAGGTNGTVNGAAHQAYLDKIESYSFNTMGVVTNDETIKTLYVNFTKRLRDELGSKFQCVLYNKAADFEGVINLKNKVTDIGWSEDSLVYWVTGATAGAAINKSNTNKKYDGEFTVDTNYTQVQLMGAISAGEFVLHRVGSDVRVLEDINSLVTTTDVKGDVFKDNQTIRIIDQVANDDAVLFNTKYLGNVPNDEAGRISFWTDIVKHREQMQNIRAIEEFNDKDVTVEQGDSKKSIVVNGAIKPINAMTKLYMTTVVV